MSTSINTDNVVGDVDNIKGDNNDADNNNDGRIMTVLIPTTVIKQ